MSTANRSAQPFTARVSSLFFRHPGFRLALFLTPALVLLGAIYGGSLLSLLVQSLYRLEEFTGLIVKEPGFQTLGELFERANLDLIVRTASMAVAVTIGCVVVAFPLSYYMARFASPRMRGFLTVAVLTPLWSSYLVRVISWQLVLAKEGIVTWILGAVLDRD